MATEGNVCKSGCHDIFLRSLSQLITYFFFYQKRFGGGTVGHEDECLGQPWNVIVYQIKKCGSENLSFQTVVFQII